jgi:hypothetical protein
MIFQWSGLPAQALSRPIQTDNRRRNLDFLNIFSGLPPTLATTIFIKW